MDIFDKLALMGRRYEPRRSTRTGSLKLPLEDVLLMYNGKAILELTTQSPGRDARTQTPDRQRKLKVSLLDAISEVHPDEGGWYEVYETPGSGDLSKVRIVSRSGDAATGELRMLVGRRNLEHYFAEDPVLETIKQRSI